jgi:threonine dehydrogenase-like Zn-dependent dehydrogenase
MKAFVFQGLGNKALENRSKPELLAAGDAIVKITKTTICGTARVGAAATHQVTAIVSACTSISVASIARIAGPFL